MKLRTLPLADSGIDRSDALRSDEVALKELWQSAKLIACTSALSRYFTANSIAHDAALSAARLGAEPL